ncbi:SARP family transcriptional regulator [Streptomyces chrestomyceticus JCM 4735]|uniref:SARP family transcriptional regulator n=1 Tax=Streptomyces chrestomyceticus JCM 4735 TaxID=1306181 RepID=A0A7U9KQU9_9ACTN|nr:BTAD domain-containing putative transcriptional regulator [Streptomyces chrestomyceticus]GCD33088.1 SARP family transcriptional regulator [Streptomyces chrestomyceticus JCM 4735]
MCTPHTPPPTPLPEPPGTAAPHPAPEPVLRVLGPMSARLGGADLPLGPPRRRALLALLLVRLGRVVPTELLVEELWCEGPPRHPVATLQSHLSHLRRVLAPAAGQGTSSVLRYQAPGYVLQLDPEQVDAFRFEQMVADGRQLLDRRDPRGARDRLIEALDLWRGAPYTEFGAQPPLSDETARLEQVRLTALESCAEARLALGAAEEVAAELGLEVRRNPARERLVGHLMTALSRLGRQAEALEVYERTRCHLVEEFGVDTAAELQRVHTAILRQELDDGGPAARLVAAPAPESPAASPGQQGGPPRRADFPAQHAAPEATAHPQEAAAPSRAARNRRSARNADRGTPVQGPARGARATGPRRLHGVGRLPARPAPVPEDCTGSGPEGTAAPWPFTGRDQELHRLTTSSAGAATGHGYLACVLGAAGVGKTRLLMELAPALETAGDALDVVWSHCFPGEGVPPYWLWTQVLRHLSATRPDAFRTATAPFDTLLAPVMPERSAGPGGQGHEDDWAQARFLTHDAVCEVLLALAAERPLVLLLEDLHWADAASLDLLRLLGTRRHGHRISIVLTARDFEADSDATIRRVLADVLRGPRTETLRLGGLSRSAVASLVEAQAGRGVGADVVDALHERSKGNPYFVMQLLSLLGDARRLHDADATDVLRAQVPTGVREALRQRFAALPEPALRVLRLCAVIGTEIDTDLLHCTATEDEPVASSLTEAIRAGLLGEDPHHPGRLHFMHALVRETLLDVLARDERHRLHARVAESLCTRGGTQVGDEEFERLAHHTWHAQDALPARQALPRLLRAAEQAEQHLAYEKVETWLRRAVHLAGLLPRDDASARALEQRLYIQLGQLLAIVRGYGDAEAEAALTRGRALGTVTRAPEDPSVLWALCSAFLVTGRYDESRQFSRLLRDIGSRTRHPVALLGAAYGKGVALHVRGRLPEALAELERSVGLADRFAREGRTLARTFQHDPRVSCRSYDAFTHWILGDRDTARARRSQLMGLTAYESRPSDRSFALYVDAVLAAWEGDAETARASSAEGARLAGEHGLLYWKAMLRLTEGWSLTHLGHGDEGVTQMQTSLAELRPSRSHLRLPLHLGLLAQAQHHAGRRDDATATLRKMLAVIEHRREHVYLHHALPATALLHDLLGRHVTDVALSG